MTRASRTESTVTPRTEAGRALLDSPYRPWSSWYDADIRRDILAIEAEARSIPQSEREGLHDVRYCAHGIWRCNEAPDQLREALQYALAFMADPDGLAHKRDEWRVMVRAALAEEPSHE